MAETKTYAPDNAQWSRHQAKFFRLTRNFEQEERHLAVAKELEWLRKDLHIAMRALNDARRTLEDALLASKQITKPEGIGYQVTPEVVGKALLHIQRACVDSDQISQNTIDFFNRVNAPEEG